jgi:hypothetical protein
MVRGHGYSPGSIFLLRLRLKKYIRLVENSLDFIYLYEFKPVQDYVRKPGSYFHHLVHT